MTALCLLAPLVGGLLLFTLARVEEAVPPGPGAAYARVRPHAFPGSRTAQRLGCRDRRARLPRCTLNHHLARRPGAHTTPRSLRRRVISRPHDVPGM